MNFEGIVPLITGAGSGLEADAGRHLVKLSANVSIVDRNKDGLTKAAAGIKSSGAPSPLPIIADVTDVERIVNKTIKHFEKLNILINNAGIFELDQQKHEHFIVQQSIQYKCLQHCFFNPIMCATSCENQWKYCRCIERCCGSIHEIFSIDLGLKGIRFNSINPAVIQTPLLKLIGMNIAIAFSADNELA